MSEPDTTNMNDEPQADDGRRASRPLLRKFVRAGLTGVIGVLGFLALAVALLDTGPGRRLVADQIARLSFENGMQIAVGRIEGSLYGEMVLHDLSLKDPKGEFLYSPEIHVDWRPFAYLFSHVDIRSATAGRMVLRRLPEFRETPPSDEPLLPDLDIDVGRLEVERFVTGKALTGEQRVAGLSGKAHVASGRAQVWFNGHTLEAGKTGGGDVVALVLDAVPEANRLALELDVKAPRGGMIAAMAGLSAPFDATLKGKGDWARWDGRLTASSGETSLSRLAITARDGTFALRGPMRLGPVFSGATGDLLTPLANVDLTARFRDRAAAINGSVASDAMRLSATGGVDLADNRFDNFRLALTLLRPSVLADNLAGSGLRALATLDGAFSMPRVAYALNADRIIMDDVGLERFSASGDARIDADRILIPVKASAGRITGLDSAAGGTLAKVRLDGDLAIQGARVLADNMRLRSDRIDAKAVLLANLKTGLYSGMIDGRIDNYRIESVGIFAIDTKADLKSDARGFALQGKVRARSTRLLNSSIDAWLGGNFVAASDVRYGGDGTVRLANLQLRAPDLVVTGGSGSYAPGGRISLVADGKSDRYGRVGVRVAGTIDDPDARITADRPGLGIGLADLDARVTGATKGYRLDLRGKTDYGPLRADVTLATRGTTRIDIASANLSGVDFTGSLTQTPQGPFSGVLRATGNGLGGVVRLDAQGRDQKAEFHIRANNSRFRGPARLRIGEAIIDGRAVFTERPQVVADMQLGDTRFRGYTINAARARIDYREGTGKARALIEGANGAPFRMAVNGVLEPSLWRVMVDGKSRGIGFRTVGPARIRPHDGGYELLPTTIEAGGGKVRLAGTYGEGMKVQSRMENVDLRFVNAFMPGIGLGGKASGSLDFTQASVAAVPRADARLKLDQFTRTSSATVSQPVDINFVGKLLPDGGEGRAVVRRRGTVIGRATVTLRPLPGGGGSWTTRLMQAPLGGGIRYNGPAETLLSFAGQPDHSVNGPLGVAADFSCRLSNPCLSGVLRGTDLTYRNAKYGTKLSDMDVSGRFSGDHLQIDSLTAKAGSGTLAASGTIGLSADAGFPMDLSIKLEDARLARSDALSASGTGQLRLTKSAGAPALLSGQLTLPETRYKIVREGSAQVPQLSGVTFKPRRGPKRVTGDEPAEAISSLFDVVRLDIDMRAPEKLYVSGMGLDSEWRARFTLNGTSVAPQMTGSVNVVRGTLDFAGRSFELSEGTVTFTGNPEIDPRVRIVASETVEDVAVNVNVNGRSSNPEIGFSSVPGLPQDEILSRILFGSSIANLSAIQAVQLAASLNSLRGNGGGLNPLGKLRSATGIDRLRILGADEANGRGTALAAGQYLTDDIYVELITDARGFTATQLEVSITPWLSVLSQAGGSGTSNVNLRVRKNY